MGEERKGLRRREGGREPQKRGGEVERERAEVWQRAVEEKMPCFVERILPGQEGEVRQSAEGGLLPGKALSHTHAHERTHTHTHLSHPLSPPPHPSLSHSLTRTQQQHYPTGVKCYPEVNASATSCSWDESGTHV